MWQIITPLKLFKQKSWYWFPAYMKRRREMIGHRVGPIKDVVFTIVDHFEPARKDGPVAVKKVREWCISHENISKKFFDADGVHPKHTWFYRCDYPEANCMKILADQVFKGFGEIEFHLHHGNDTEASFEKKIKRGCQWLTSFGAIFHTDISCPQFSYIAGNWALDNGRKESRFSGVDTEIKVLSRNGCYADFTFPALGVSSQPQMVNCLYYAKENGKSKSYNKGELVRIGGQKEGDLMMFLGPLFVDWKNQYLEHAALEEDTGFFPERIGYWLKAGVGVGGRPDVVFIKLHTHGMQHRVTLMDRDLENLFSEITKDAKREGYRLHYCSAREAFNIAKGLENGYTGPIGDIRDYVVPIPINGFIRSSHRYKEFSLKGDNLIAEFLGAGPKDTIELEFKTGLIRRIVIQNSSRLEIDLKKILAEKNRSGNHSKDVRIELRNNLAGNY